jgi:hypothetical protein
MSNPPRQAPRRRWPFDHRPVRATPVKRPARSGPPPEAARAEAVNGYETRYDIASGYVAEPRIIRR